MAREDFDGVSQQTKAGRERLKDAQELITAERWQGAMYMAGYAVECLLKSKLMKLYGCRHLRQLEEELTSRGELKWQGSIYTHNLDILLEITKSSDRLKQNAEICRTYNLVNRWMPAWRYSTDEYNSQDAIEFMEAVAKLIHWINNNI